VKVVEYVSYEWWIHEKVQEWKHEILDGFSSISKVVIKMQLDVLGQ
jgi:hypothetical protein